LTRSYLSRFSAFCEFSVVWETKFLNETQINVKCLKIWIMGATVDGFDKEGTRLDQAENMLHPHNRVTIGDDDWALKKRHGDPYWLKPQRA
jgi:hypothetical protein